MSALWLHESLTHPPWSVIEETCLDIEQWVMDICSASKEPSQVVSSSGYFPLAKQPLITVMFFLELLCKPFRTKAMMKSTQYFFSDNTKHSLVSMFQFLCTEVHSSIQSTLITKWCFNINKTLQNSPLYYSIFISYLCEPQHSM